MSYRLYLTSMTLVGIICRKHAPYRHASHRRASHRHASHRRTSLAGIHLHYTVRQAIVLEQEDVSEILEGVGEVPGDDEIAT